MKRIVLLALVFVFSAFAASAQVKKAVVKKPVKAIVKKPVTGVKKPIKFTPPKIEVDNSTKVRITTDLGEIVVKLYDSTPLHKANFLKLVEQKFYDSLLFHRVISSFMIQGGDPTSKFSQPGEILGNGGADMQRIPAEFRPELIHLKGALAAARDGNPEKASSACQFYLVQGKILTDSELDMMQQRNNIKYTPEQRAAYKTYGGTAFLDQNYTVFGMIVSGMEVVDKISSLPKNAMDRPNQDIRMKMEIIK
jgi:cyclophilin family peptidyl-prolyl cis-trans isomerase